MENPYNLISQLLEDINNRRTQDVIARRFGLHDGQQKTLQEIGDQYHITRERIRQIEKNGLEQLLKSAKRANLAPLEEELASYLDQHGQMRREEKIFDDMVCVCFPASQLKTIKDTEAALCRAALNLILTLGPRFSRLAEDEEFYPVWTLDKKMRGTAKKVVDSAVKYLNKNHQPLKDSELYQIIKNGLPELSQKAAASYIDASKAIEQNNFGEFGLVDWPEISPRGVRDKAYLILKKEGKPFHFVEVTDLINRELPQPRPAYVQTVHNELIKDPRFVLIGRGIYALSEWGYEPGTVVDVIKQILKREGPLGKEEILKKVLEKRLIKEATVLINLQNKKFFKKLEDGRIALV